MDADAREEVERLRRELREALDCVAAYQHTITGRVLANSAALDALLCGIRSEQPALRAAMSEAFVHASKGLIESTRDLDPRIGQARDERLAALKDWLAPPSVMRDGYRAT